ncbi:hypothetical protein CRG98_016293 [Punica granatum]|uniref:Uncharacterized protein n=1 Tax=Punica granatum TaxID=22663 RepID=A0A2I0K445_PUNGR|nr:hypothetical protein CRG98_016293 [Punica granatum]
MPASTGWGNLQRFLDSVAPTAPSRTVYRDLWERYGEWSAFQAESRATLKTRVTVKQYYTPYLSALQIYIAAKLVVAASRNRREGDGPVEMDSLQVRTVGAVTCQDCSGYVKGSSPNCFKAQIAVQFGCVRAASCLIPRSILGLDPVFLFYLGVADDCDKSSDKISLFPFGIAIYKMQGDLWLTPRTAEHVRFMDLQRAASSWLKQFNVYHHDSSFFACHSNIIAPLIGSSGTGVGRGKRDSGMFMLVVFVVGFVLGAIAVLGLEALGVLFVINKLSQKTRKLEQSLIAANDVDYLLPLDFLHPKQAFCRECYSLSSGCYGSVEKSQNETVTPLRSFCTEPGIRVEGFNHYLKSYNFRRSEAAGVRVGDRDNSKLAELGK